MSIQGYGISFEYESSGSVWTSVGFVQDAVPMPIIKENYDDTHHGTSGVRTFKSGLVEYGESSIVVQYNPADTSHAELRDRAKDPHRPPDNYRFIYSDGSQEEFSAIIANFTPESPIDDKAIATITFKGAGTYDVTTP